MKAKNTIVSILKSIFPSTKAETYVFLFFVLAYGINAYVIADQYRIVFDNRVPWDAYFSFDNRSIVLTGGGYERHPLSNYFFDAIRKFALLISGNHYNDVFRIVLALLSSVVISLGNVQVFKYLSGIIGLPNRFSLLLVLMYGLFVTNILLSFTPETYTYSLFFLTIFNVYAARKINADQNISWTVSIVGSVFIGGMTVTNVVKTYIPFLFEKKLFWNWKKIGMAVAKVVVSLGIFVLLFLIRINFNIQGFLNKTGEQYEKFSNPKVISIWDMMASWFFGGNTLFSSFIVKDYHNQNSTFFYKAIFMDVYSSYFQYGFVFLLLGLVLWAVLKNYKNKLIWILMFSFLVDIIIHCVMKFGLHTSYIYGGHFVFVYPLMIGWLLSGYKNNPKTLSLILGGLMLMTLYLGINNCYRFGEFYQFLEQYYR